MTENDPSQSGDDPVRVDPDGVPRATIEVKKLHDGTYRASYGDSWVDGSTVGEALRFLVLEVRGEIHGDLHRAEGSDR